MSLETGFWRIEGNKPHRIPPTAFDYEARLEAVLESDISIVSEPRRWMVIGRQVPTDHGGYIDLLALDVTGNLIGQVDAESFKVRRLSFYAELIWEARLKRSRSTIEQKRRQMDWVVVRNRTGHTDARNQRRLDAALGELSKRVGFRVAQGLSERVIYRELFPSGLTLLDKGHLGELGTSHLVARQELRSLVASLALPMPQLNSGRASSAAPQPQLALADSSAN